MPETASGLFQGDRKQQQDSVDSFGHKSTGLTLLALSDGIGSAGYGNLASRLIVRTAMTNLRGRLTEIATGSEPVSEVLHGAALAANRTLASAVAEHPDKKGMGGTLILSVITSAHMYFLSIGDSPIYRLRGSELIRLNKLHSLASGLDGLAAMGKLDPKVARSMAARSTLTSALTGQKLAKVDVPVEGEAVQPGDILLLASDGIETLSEQELATLMVSAHEDGAARTVAGIIGAIEKAGKQGQDNVAVTVVVA